LTGRTVAALANLNVKAAYLDGELCGVNEAGVPSFAQTQAATDGERGVRLVYYAFDLLQLDGHGVSGLPLIDRKALLEPLVAGKPGLQFNGDETGDGELILKHAGKLGFEGVVSKTIDAPYAREKPGPPIANMRKNGVRAVIAACQGCEHKAGVNVDALPETIVVPETGRRLRCSQCGGKWIHETREAYDVTRWPALPQRIEYGKAAH
jgi:ATP dependent DNA ligase-like protein